MKPVLFIVGMLLSNLAFSQGYLDKIKDKVGETVWSKIPEVSIDYGNLNAFEPEYPIFSPAKIPDEGMMLFTLPSGRKGLAFRQIRYSENKSDSTLVYRWSGHSGA